MEIDVTWSVVKHRQLLTSKHVSNGQFSTTNPIAAWLTLQLETLRCVNAGQLSAITAMDASVNLVCDTFTCVNVGQFSATALREASDRPGQCEMSRCFNGRHASASTLTIVSVNWKQKWKFKCVNAGQLPANDRMDASARRDW